MATLHPRLVQAWPHDRLEAPREESLPAGGSRVDRIRSLGGQSQAGA